MKRNPPTNPVRMRTPLGEKLGFELRRVSVGHRDRVWLVNYRDGGARPASEVEVRLWKSLPSHLRNVTR